MKREDKRLSYSKIPAVGIRYIKHTLKNVLTWSDVIPIDSYVIISIRT